MDKFETLMKDEDNKYEVRIKILLKNMLEDRHNCWERAIEAERKGPKTSA